MFDDDCRLAFNIKQGAHLRWTRDRSRVNLDEFDHYQRRANAVYAEAMCQFSVRSRDVLMNAQCPHQWWSTLKSAVFGLVSSSSYWGGWWSGLVCKSVGKADISAHFDGKQSRDPGDLHPLAVRCLQVTGGEAAPAGSGFLWWHWPIGYVSSFFERTAEVLAPRLTVVFRRLLVWVAFLFAG